MMKVADSEIREVIKRAGNDPAKLAEARALLERKAREAVGPSVAPSGALTENQINANAILSGS